MSRDAPADPRDFIHEPCVLEFPSAQPDAGLYELDLEQGLLDQLQKFLMELGKALRLLPARSTCGSRAKTVSWTWCFTTTGSSAVC